MRAAKCRDERKRDKKFSKDRVALQETDVDERRQRWRNRSKEKE